MLSVLDAPTFAFTVFRSDDYISGDTFVPALPDFGGPILGDP
jgi:hypothetical protein